MFALHNAQGVGRCVLQDDGRLGVALHRGKKNLDHDQLAVLEGIIEKTRRHCSFDISREGSNAILAMA